MSLLRDLPKIAIAVFVLSLLVIGSSAQAKMCGLFERASGSAKACQSLLVPVDMVDKVKACGAKDKACNDTCDKRYDKPGSDDELMECLSECSAEYGACTQ